MKLIDLLVRELPKRGGWPKLAKKIHQDHDGEVWGWINEDDPQRIFTLDQVATNARPRAKDETYENMVTRDQYEAAIAAAQQPVWDGEGLPPVGVNAEVSVDGGRSWCSYKATSENNGMRLVEIGNFTEEFRGNNWMFRPIRSEDDRRRDEIAKNINAAVDASGTLGHVLYDAIAAGKIPHIRIE
ncbi:hypothetical protein ACVS99_004109 [Cronobacter malonaticus]